MAGAENYAARDGSQVGATSNGCVGGVCSNGMCGPGYGACNTGCGMFDPWAGYTPVGGCGNLGCGVFGGGCPKGGACGVGCGPGGYGYSPLNGVGTGVGLLGGAGGNLACRPKCRHWFGGVYGLYMTRDHDNVVWLSYDSTLIGSRLLGSHDADTDWQAGNEIRFGATMVCAPCAWEVVYWGLYDESASATVLAANVGNPISTSLDFGGLDYDDGIGVGGVNGYYDNVEAHRVRRHFELQNIELNLIKFPLFCSVGPCGVRCGADDCGTACGATAAYANAGAAYGGGTGQQNFGGMYGTSNPCGPRFTIVGVGGVRYLRIDEGFSFASSQLDTVFGDDPEDMQYTVETENHLVGLQLGCAANYQKSQCLSFYCDSKFGVFYNNIDHDSRIYGNNGFAYVTAGLPYAGQAYNVQTNKDDVSLLGELRLGAAYNLRPNWRVYGGWRAVGVAGVALPFNQIPQNFADIGDVQDIDSNGSIIVHGLQAGVEGSF